MVEHVDILISGGGIAGLTAAAAFGQAGFSVLLVDPAPPVKDSADPEADLRSTAYLPPARALFEQIGLWDVLLPHAVSLDALRIIDTTGTPPKITETRTFDPSDLDETTFGWNLPNWLTRRELAAAIARQPGVELALGTGFKSMLQRSREAIVTLSDKRQIHARLVIGADGRASPVREAAGIDVQIQRYGQKVLAFSATHALPHDNISTEIYNQGGAFTTVPLSDHQGRPTSAIVWMNDGARANALAAMDTASFNAEMTQRACGLLGPMERVGGVRVWPVVTQRATALTGERVALIAEAAHVLPPIGAQGLNTSLHDVAALLSLAQNDPGALGTPAHLAAYEKTRARDIALRAHAIDIFNRICKSGDSPVQALRRNGLKLVHDIAPLRKAIMRAGLGPA
jgi:2-octaprenyl-6-methoxyphenol hydroxylase